MKAHLTDFVIAIPAVVAGSLVALRLCIVLELGLLIYSVGVLIVTLLMAGVAWGLKPGRVGDAIAAVAVLSIYVSQPLGAYAFFTLPLGTL